MAKSQFDSSRLEKLKHSNYEIKDGEPDIRGWDVKDSGGKTIGKVEELIFDEQSRKVRYMVVSLDNNDLDLDKRDVLIPIGLGELHKSDDDIILPGITADQLKSLPEYKANITSADETTIRNIFAGAGIAGLSAAELTAADTDFYNYDHFNEENLTKNRKTDLVSEGEATIPVIEEELQIGKRTVETGGAYIRSKIIEKPVEETVSLQEEHVHVERTEVNRIADLTDFDTFKEGEIELREYAEVPVITKEARVVEEVVIGKEVQERDETIHDTIRKIEVDIENLGTDKGNTSATGLSGDL